MSFAPFRAHSFGLVARVAGWSTEIHHSDPPVSCRVRRGSSLSVMTDKMRRSQQFGGVVVPEEAVVVPLVSITSEPGTEDMLRMLLNREALLISRAPASAQGASSGLVAQSTGAFAKAISQAAGQLGRSSGSVEGLYRVIMPTGSVARDLVPAVGGGFRGIARAAGSTKITGQVRLVPAVAGAGATVAAGPLIATVGLAVAGEMLAQHQMNKKLDGIKNALVGIETRANDHDRSVLSTAAQQAGKVASYLLDQAHIQRSRQLPTRSVNWTLSPTATSIGLTDGST